MTFVVFRSKAAGEIPMFEESAQRLFEIIGRAYAERGVFTVEQIPAAIAHLEAAVEAERVALRAAAQEAARDERRGEGRAPEPVVTLGQRAWPLLEMLRAAQRQAVDVTWGF